MVPNSSGDLRLETNHFASQWDDGREVVIESVWGHEISMVALNNGTHIYFPRKMAGSPACKQDFDMNPGKYA